MAVMLMDEEALKKRFAVVYAQMRERAKPKFWKAGKLKGRVRVPGVIGLPFTREQFWQHGLKQVGTSVIKCPYCEEIGRPANLISLANCVWDHRVPVYFGGKWELSNLFAVCADCNNLKGRLSYEFFVAIMAALEKWDNSRDRTLMHMCMRTHGVAHRVRFYGNKTESRNAVKAAEEQPSLALEESW